MHRIQPREHRQALCVALGKRIDLQDICKNPDAGVTHQCVLHSPAICGFTNKALKEMIWQCNHQTLVLCPRREAE